MGDMGSEAKDCNEHYRIGIVTYWDADDNYGQLLQCYALQRHLRLQGHDAFLIRYSRRKNPVIRIKSFLLPVVCGLSYIFSKEKYLKYKYLIQEEKRRKRNAILSRQRQFGHFRETNLKVSKIYRFPSLLRCNPPTADVYICGSDQIWNTDILGRSGAPYFLSFGNRAKKKIAYAASIGGRRLTQPEMDKVSVYLKSFSAISVRDVSTKDMCLQCGRSDAVITVDPTLLLPVSEYRLLFADEFSHKERYLFVYALNVLSSEELYWTDVEKYVQRCKLAVHVVYASGYCKARELISGHSGIYATIPEWLAYVYNAAYVLTTSYHGVVFAVKMNRPFLAVLLEGRFSFGNDRIVSFLQGLGLAERIYSPGKSFYEQMEREIDWVTINAHLERKSQESSDFLKEAISF